jgi:hypothetical protein
VAQDKQAVVDELRHLGYQEAADAAVLELPDQILDLVIAIATIPGDPGYLEPILRTALDGLRPPIGADQSTAR